MNPRGILSAKVVTPTIRLKCLFPEFGKAIFAQLECRNPSGTVGDSTSLTILQKVNLDISSTGAVVSAVEKLSPLLASNASIAFFTPNRGEHYLDAIFSKAWVNGDINFIN